MLTNPSACRTSMPTVRRGCITTSLGIMSLMRVGLLIRIRLGCGVGRICILFSPNTQYWVDFLGLRGVYFFTDMTQSYIGKGPLSRMRQSIRYRTGPKPSNPMSKPTACVHVKLKSNKMALMVEARLMVIHNAKLNPSFMNKILSNGVKLYADKNTTARERNIADRYAKVINQRMENVKSGKCKSAC